MGTEVCADNLVIIKLTFMRQSQFLLLIVHYSRLTFLSAFRSVSVDPDVEPICSTVPQLNEQHILETKD